MPPRSSIRSQVPTAPSLASQELQVANCKLQIFNLKFAIFNLQCTAVCFASLITLLSSPVGIAQVAPRPSAPFEFTRLVAHWTDYGRPDYLDFVRDAEPEVVQVGFYGAHFWSLVHTPQYGGYPAHFPVRGIDEASESFHPNSPIRTRFRLNSPKAGFGSRCPSSSCTASPEFAWIERHSGDPS